MTDYLIVLNKDEDTVSFIDEPTGKIVKTVSVGKNPHEVSVTPDGQKAYISCAGENTVEVFDMKKLELITIIKHPEFRFPHESAVLPDGSKVVLASTYANKVFIIDVATNAVEKIIEGRRMTHMVSLHPDGSKAYISNIGDNSISVLDIA
ncbi:MAG: YncE family protein [Candidatus Heimdallarchaeota archaeon]